VGVCLDRHPLEAVRQVREDPREPKQRCDMKILTHAGVRIVTGILLALAGVPGASRAQPTLAIESYAVPGNCVVVWKVTPGPDGAIWFTMTQREDTGCTTPLRRDSIGRITAEGAITEYPLPPTDRRFGRGLHGITAGPDGALWFVEIRSSKIGRITTDGEVQRWGLGPGNRFPYEITTGSDGALWFTESYAVGRRTAARRLVTRYPIASLYSTDPTAIVSGPDGAVWMTALNSNAIERITTSGDVHVFPLTTPCTPHGIASGPDGALWFTCFTGNAVGRITVGGAVTMYPLPTPGAGPVEITAGPDGALWFTEQDARQIGRITTDGMITEYASGPGAGNPLAITSAPDGLWFTKGAYISHILVP
jgi:virginiamycin B lyase